MVIGRDKVLKIRMLGCFLQFRQIFSRWGRPSCQDFTTMKNKYGSFSVIRDMYINHFWLIFFSFFVVYKLHSLPLRELYCEGNNLLQHLPVHSEQEEEILSLKVNFGTNFINFVIYYTIYYIMLCCVMLRYVLLCCYVMFHIYTFIFFTLFILFSKFGICWRMWIILARINKIKNLLPFFLSLICCQLLKRNWNMSWLFVPLSGKIPVLYYVNSTSAALINIYNYLDIKGSMGHFRQFVCSKHPAYSGKTCGRVSYCSVNTVQNLLCSRKSYPVSGITFLYKQNKIIWLVQLFSRNRFV